MILSMWILPHCLLAAFGKFYPLPNVINQSIINTMHNYPNNLRELRKTKGMLQIEVAQLLGHLNSDRMSDWEKGYAMPSVVNLFKLASIYGVPTEDLYREINVTAAQEVEDKRASLITENEWVRRMKLKEAAGMVEVV